VEEALVRSDQEFVEKKRLWESENVALRERVDNLVAERDKYEGEVQAIQAARYIYFSCII
jgi:hypothetical protein